MRERGRPAPAVVVSARAHRERWRAVLRVEPFDGEPFEVEVQFAVRADEEPQAGDLLEVLHEGRHAVPLSDPAHLRRPAPADPSPEVGPPEDAPPAAHEVIGQLLRRLADGSLTGGEPAIVVDDPGGGPLLPAAPTDPALADLPLEALIAHSEAHPAPVGDEILRRLTAGATTFPAVLEAARSAGPAGASAVEAVLDDLHRRGRIGARTLATLRRLLG